MNFESTNIKNLPTIDQITNNDYLVVENFLGTNKLQFKDFVIAPSNTSFYTPIVNTINTLSAQYINSDLQTTNNVKTLSSDILKINNNFSELNTTIQTFSALNVSLYDYLWVRNIFFFRTINPLTYDPDVTGTITNFILETSRIFTFEVFVYANTAIYNTDVVVSSQNRPLYFSWDYGGYRARMEVWRNGVLIGRTYFFRVTANEAFVDTDRISVGINQWTPYSQYQKLINMPQSPLIPDNETGNGS